MSAQATRCRESIEAGETALAAARPGVRDWKTHVQTRTALLSGRIGKATATATFKRTRLSGAEEIKKFDSSYASYEPTRSACKDAGSEVPQTCADRASALDTTVRRAETAMGDWARHQANMAAFKEGDFGAAHAQDLWVESWRTAPRNIERFQKADADLSSAPRCPGPA